MAKKEDSSNQKSGANVAQLATKCPSENCTKKPAIAGFCEEHFVWFKEGLITKEGDRPSDFDKKLAHFLRRKKAA